MSQYAGNEWDHDKRVRVGAICVGHLSDAIYNALARVVWEHHGQDDYYSVLISTTRALMMELLTKAGEHQDEWTQFLQDAMSSAGDTCRGPNPDSKPAYRARWDHDTQHKMEQMQREAEEQSVSEREAVRARLRRWQQQRDN